MESTHLYAVIFLAFVEPEVVQQSDTGVKAPTGFSPLSQWGQRCDFRLLSSTVIYLAEPQHIHEYPIVLSWLLLIAFPEYPHAFFKGHFLRCHPQWSMVSMCQQLKLHSSTSHIMTNKWDNIKMSSNPHNVCLHHVLYIYLIVIFPCSDCLLNLGLQTSH